MYIVVSCNLVYLELCQALVFVAAAGFYDDDDDDECIVQLVAIFLVF